MNNWGSKRFVRYRQTQLAKRDMANNKTKCWTIQIGPWIENSKDIPTTAELFNKLMRDRASKTVINTNTKITTLRCFSNPLVALLQYKKATIPLSMGAAKLSHE